MASRRTTKKTAPNATAQAAADDKAAQLDPRCDHCGSSMRNEGGTYVQLNETEAMILWGLLVSFEAMQQREIVSAMKAMELASLAKELLEAHEGTLELIARKLDPTGSLMENLTKRLRRLRAHDKEG